MLSVESQKETLIARKPWALDLGAKPRRKAFKGGNL